MLTIVINEACLQRGSCHIRWLKTNGIIISKQCWGGEVLDKSKTYMQKIQDGAFLNQQDIVCL